MKKLTKRQSDKVTALRAEAEMHGDSKMVATCDAVLAGDTEALAACGIVVKAAKAAAVERKPARRSAWEVPMRAYAHDVEDLTGIPQ